MCLIEAAAKEEIMITLIAYCVAVWILQFNGNNG